MSRVVNLPLLSRSARPDAPVRALQPRALVGPLAAAQAAALGLVVVTLVVLLGWATAAYSRASAADALSVAAQGWLLAHHTDLVVPGGRVTIAPLGLLLLPGGLVVVTAAWAARAAGVDSVRSGALLAVAVCLPYAAVAALVAAGLGEVASRWQAGASALVIAAGATGLAVVREAGLAPRLLDRVPLAARGVLAGAGAGVLGLVGSGALVFGAGLLWRHQRHVDLVTALAPGAVGGVLLTVLGLLLLPNAAVWGAAYVLGPGFAVGTGTVVAPGGVALGAVPAVPLLAALPPSGPGSAATYAVLLVPVLAGMLIALTVERRLSAVGGGSAAPGTWAAVAYSAGAAALAGLLLGALAWCSGGALGGGRMAELGPSWWRVALAGVLVLSPVAAATALGRRRWTARRSRELAPPPPASPPAPAPAPGSG